MSHGPISGRSASARGRPVIDLHLHTYGSDGVFPARKVVEQAQANGVRVAALTDHDTMEAARDTDLVRALRALGGRAPQIVPGVEISCHLEAPLAKGGKEYLHIIGLGVDPRDPELRKALIAQRLGISARIRDCIAKLQADGFDIRYGEIGRTCGLEAPTERTLGEILAAKGYAKDADTARKELVAPRLTKNGELPERFEMDPAEAIALIHAAGGVAILAHPHRYVPTHDEPTLRALFARLAAVGLDGAEVYRFDLEPAEQPRYRELIEEAGLLVSGGSDFHAPSRGGVPRAPGDARAPLELWEPLAERIRARGGCTDIRDLNPGKHPHASAAERMLYSMADPSSRSSRAAQPPPPWRRPRACASPASAGAPLGAARGASR